MNSVFPVGYDRPGRIDAFASVRDPMIMSNRKGERKALRIPIATLSDARDGAPLAMQVGVIPAMPRV